MCWHWLGARLCPRAPHRGYCSWGQDPLTWTGNHQRHGERCRGAGCWQGSGGGGWSDPWNDHPGGAWKWKKAVRCVVIAIWSPLLCYSGVIIQTCRSIRQKIHLCSLPTFECSSTPRYINLTLITVNLFESRWRALSRRRSLKAEGRIWLMVFLDSVRCNRLVMLAKSFRRTAGFQRRRKKKESRHI